jgi:hypothetical protein
MCPQTATPELHSDMAQCSQSGQSSHAEGPTVLYCWQRGTAGRGTAAMVQLRGIVPSDWGCQTVPEHQRPLSTAVRRASLLTRPTYTTPQGATNNSIGVQMTAYRSLYFSTLSVMRDDPWTPLPTAPNWAHAIAAWPHLRCNLVYFSINPSTSQPQLCNSKTIL